MKTRKLTALVITLAMLALCACDAQPTEPTQTPTNVPETSETAKTTAPTESEPATEAPTTEPTEVKDVENVYADYPKYYVTGYYEVGMPDEEWEKTVYGICTELDDAIDDYEPYALIFTDVENFGILMQNTDVDDWVDNVILSFCAFGYEIDCKQLKEDKLFVSSTFFIPSFSFGDDKIIYRDALFGYNLIMHEDGYHEVLDTDLSADKYVRMELDGSEIKYDATNIRWTPSIWQDYYWVDAYRSEDEFGYERGSVSLNGDGTVTFNTDEVYTVGEWFYSEYFPSATQVKRAKKYNCEGIDEYVNYIRDNLLD